MQLSRYGGDTFFFPLFLSHKSEGTTPTILLQHKNPGIKLSWSHGCYSQKHLSWRRVRIHRWCILTTLAPLYQCAVEMMETSALQRKSSWGISLSDTVVLQSLAHPCFQRASLEGILKWQPLGTSVLKFYAILENDCTAEILSMSHPGLLSRTHNIKRRNRSKPRQHTTLKPMQYTRL